MDVVVLDQVCQLCVCFVWCHDDLNVAGFAGLDELVCHVWGDVDCLLEELERLGSLPAPQQP